MSSLGLKHLDPLPGDHRPFEKPNQLLRLARKHGAGDHLDPARTWPRGIHQDAPFEKVVSRIDFIVPHSTDFKGLCFHRAPREDARHADSRKRGSSSAKRLRESGCQAPPLNAPLPHRTHRGWVGGKFDNSEIHNSEISTAGAICSPYEPPGRAHPRSLLEGLPTSSGGGGWSGPHLRETRPFPAQESPHR